MTNVILITLTAFVFVDITLSYWWIYYFFDGCHKTQWGELWFEWYMLKYLICICIFIGPWCNRVRMTSIIGKHFSVEYIVMHCLIMSFHISVSLTSILYFHHKVTCTFISNLKLHLHVSTIIKENLKFLLTITFCRNMMEILHLITKLEMKAFAS